MVDFKPTTEPRLARPVSISSQDYQEHSRNSLTEAWSELTNDESKNMLAKLVLEFAENKNITDKSG